MKFYTALVELKNGDIYKHLIKIVPHKKSTLVSIRGWNKPTYRIFFYKGSDIGYVTNIVERIYNINDLHHITIE